LLVSWSIRVLDVRASGGHCCNTHGRQHCRTGFLPVLDVVDIPTAAPAIALYRAEGWREIARVSFDLADMHLEEIVFTAPAD